MVFSVITEVFLGKCCANACVTCTGKDALGQGRYVDDCTSSISSSIRIGGMEFFFLSRGKGGYD